MCMHTNKRPAYIRNLLALKRYQLYYNLVNVGRVIIADKRKKVVFPKKYTILFQVYSSNYTLIRCRCFLHNVYTFTQYLVFYLL
jgi:hypothetical protein